MPRFGLVVQKDLRLDDEFSMGVNFMQEIVFKHKVTSLVIPAPLNPHKTQEIFE